MAMMIRTAASRGGGLTAAAAARGGQACPRQVAAGRSWRSTLASAAGGAHGHASPSSSSSNRDDAEAERRRMAQINPISICATGSAANGTTSSHQFQMYRSYHFTPAPQRGGPALALGLASVAAVAKAGQYAAQAFEQYKIEAAASKEEEARRRKEAGLPSEEEERAQQEAEAAQAKAEGGDAKKKEKEEESGPRENIFNKFFNMGVGSKFYEGGFEEEMTRREAALILGVRESSTPKRIKEAHRKLLVLNHPDTGGSTYLSGKINEAKELLLKGRK